MRITEKSIIKRNISLKPVENDGQLSMLNVETGKYIVLNSIGAAVWKITSISTSVQDIIRQLIVEYDVSYEECKKSILPYLEKLRKERVISVN